MLAYIHNLEVSLSFDLTVPQSTLSASIVQAITDQLGIGDTHATSITVPTDHGPFTVDLLFLVVERTVPHVVLGADWMASFVQIVTNSRFHLGSRIFNPMQPRAVTHQPVHKHDTSLLLDTIRRDIDHFDFSFNQPVSPLYVFHSDSSVLSRHMAYHGINDLSSSIEESQEKLVHHLLSAACLVVAGDGQRKLGCDRFSRNFRSSLHMSYEAYGQLLRDVDLPLNHLRLAWRAVYGGANAWRYEYRELQDMLRAQCTKIAKSFASLYPLKTTIHTIYSSRKSGLIEMAAMHGIVLPTSSTRPQLQRLLLSHIVTSECLVDQTHLPLGCNAIQLGLENINPLEHAEDPDTTLSTEVVQTDRRALELEMYKILMSSLRPADFGLLSDALSIITPPDLSSKQLYQCLSDEVSRLDVVSIQNAPLIDPYHYSFSSSSARPWPSTLNNDVKETLLSNFLDATSSMSLTRRICGICTEYVASASIIRARSDKLSLDLLSRHGHNYEEAFSSPLSYPQTISHGLLAPYLIDPSAVHNINATTLQDIFVDVCSSCHSALAKRRLPACALANGTYVGPVPPVLSDLSVVEEAMIALCRTKCMVIQLRETEGNRSSPIHQKAIKGNVIVYPQDANSIARILPPSIAEMASFICVMFVGSMTLSDETLLKSTPLAVRGDKIIAALRWLQANNPLYRHIQINLPVIAEVQRLGFLPLHVQRVELSQRATTLVSRYDAPEEEVNGEHEIPFDSVLIAGVDPLAAPNVIRAAALRHLKENRGNFIRIPYDPTPVNSFDNPRMFPMMFPTLFPYGIGGFEDKARSISLSMSVHVKHLLNRFDRRFQQHHVFMFSAFNILQRRESLLRISLRTKQSSFHDIAAQLTSISSETVRGIYERLQAGGSFAPANDQESRVFKLMQEVNVVNRSVPGSPSGKITMRNQLRALMLEKGLPSFFITLNPADVYNPIVKFLSGANINIDDMKGSEIPSFWTQALLVAKNPCIGASFFNLYMKAFIHCLLGYRSNGYDEHSIGGVLGFTNAYYGCVEAQGRGTLHCHMLVWLDGALNPDEVKRRLLSDEAFASTFLRYLEDIIHNHTPPAPEVTVPSDTVHPSAIRSVHPRLSPSPVKRTKDLHNIVTACQHHRHSHTCYKYSSGTNRECRFGISVDRARPHSLIDSEGAILLRCDEGLVNDYNPTILEAMRCNMDIKFIGSGVSAKATLYYVTDYITKPDEKSYNSYAALELAVRRTEATNNVGSDLYARSKQLLQKCASSMISRQELSAPFVATYLLGLQDHFTSHLFCTLYWTSFESYVDRSLNRMQEVTGSDHLEGIMDGGEMVFDSDDDGVLTPVAVQVEDYVYRSKTLDRFSVWDTVAQLRKTRTQSNNSSKIHPFLAGHRDRTTHGFSVLPRVKVPVPIGPALPRRDRQETITRHAKVMLILFKPWRHVSDLKAGTESWEDAYHQYLRSIPPHALFVINNMQLLHECRDSRDDHYDAMRRSRKAGSVAFASEAVSANPDDDNVDAFVDEVEMLDHLESVDRARAAITSQMRSGVTESLLLAVESGLIQGQDLEADGGVTDEDSDNVTLVDHARNQPEKSLEAKWKKAYKELAALSPSDQSVSIKSSFDTQASLARVQKASIYILQSPSIVSGSHVPVLSGTELVAVVETEYTLNKEQRRAFRIVANHTLETQPEQLKMFLMGPGGTGKSRVIHALTDFFARRSQSHRFTIAAFTGVAAVHVGGGTLHSMLSLNSELKKGKRKGHSKSLRNLMSKWEDIDYLLIDEISMVGCALLHDISEALMTAKGSHLPFGGVNVIFCGDFAQIPPVKQQPLFTQFDSNKRSLLGPNDSTLLGRNLWLQVDCVIELTEVMRQSGAENAYFVSLLNRVRNGACTEEDHFQLNSRLITTVNPDWLSDKWSNTPVLVYSNDMKDALNSALASAFAATHNKPLHWYYADDTCKGRSFTTEQLRTHLNRVDSGRAHQRMGKLPLVEGMPVMITHNYAVESGIANGTLGTLRRIRYQKNEFGERVAISCTVSLPNSKVKFPGLEPGEVPVLQDDAYITVAHPFDAKKSTTFKRRQLCLMPGFAFTAHKAEGMTLTRVIVDLQSCRGIESVYVMLSRVKSLDGLLLLRPFGLNKIRCRPSQDRRIEADRLRILCLQTICKYGEPEEVEHANSSLRKLNISVTSGLNEFGKRTRDSV